MRRDSVPQNKCYRVEHIKKPDYNQNIQAIFYFKNIYDHTAKIQGTFQVYQIGEVRAACCLLFGMTTGSLHGLVSLHVPNTDRYMEIHDFLPSFGT